ncbi:MAG: T9SS type A sorting domain-containing protein [Bacteroidota bacterium]
MRILFVIWILFIGANRIDAQNTGLNGSGAEFALTAGNDLNSMLDVRVYPNPVTDRRLNIELTDQSIQELRISNIAGSVVYSKKFQVPVTKHQVTLDNVPSGVYLLRVISDGNLTRTTKLMIRNQ